ncbi:hypothetical protein GCM10011418_44190 [Sphingobacterium alkalisoli]|nr:hypothetical protein GCM10011418_44190 [Sphingobacterium alkalisoli]
MKSNEMSTQLYNGLVDFEEKLMEVKQGNLSETISIKYNFGGVKVNEIPGWVGLSFNLKVGGVISRIIKGIPDDSGLGILNIGQEMLTEYNKVYPSDAIVKQVTKSEVDCHPDLFYVSAPGLSAKFVFDYQGNICFLNGEKIKLEYSRNYQITSFTLTNDNGIKYVFSTVEKSYFGKSIPEESYISSWYLTKIIDLNNEEINYHYTAETNRYRFKETAVTRQVHFRRGGNVNDFDLFKTDGIYSRDQVIYLNRITTKLHEIRFIFSDRDDIVYHPPRYSNLGAKEQKLDEIQLYDLNENILKKVRFQYRPSESRLMLSDIYQQSVQDQTEQLMFRFSYNSERFTSYGMFNGNPYASNSIDDWGYYNGINNGITRIPTVFSFFNNRYLYGADRSIIPSKVKACILEKIEYGTGGTVSFEHESNDYDPGDIEEGYESVYNEYSFFYEEGVFDTDPSTISFNLDVGTNVEIRKEIIPIGPNRSWLSGAVSQTSNLFLSAGDYTLQQIFQTNQLFNPGNSDIQTASGKISFTKRIKKDRMIGPGLRIKRIKWDYDGQISTKQYFYRLQGTNKSSGQLDSKPIYYAGFTGGVGASGFVMSSARLNERQDALPVGYSRVEEIMDDNSKIVYHYSNFSEASDQTASPLDDIDEKLLANISNAQSRGKVRKVEYFDALGRKIRSVNNDYSELPDWSETVVFLDLKSLFYKNLTSLYSDPQDLLPANIEVDFLILQKSAYQSRFVVLTKTTTSEYFNNNSEPLISTKEFLYGNSDDNQIRKIRSTNSKSDEVINYFTYPADYKLLNEGWVADLINSNNLSLPIETVTVNKSNNRELVTSGKYLEYYRNGKGILKNVFHLSQESPTNLTSFKFGNLTQGLTPPSAQNQQYGIDSRYRLFKNYLSYDDFLNPREVKVNAGATTIYLWGYGGQYPVAKIENATYAEVLLALGGGTIANNKINALNSPTVSDATIKTILDSLRNNVNMQKAQISSYTYRPLVGMTSMTDPRGITEYYEYDGFQRLKDVLDFEDNVLKNYRYHYRP